MYRAASTEGFMQLIVCVNDGVDGLSVYSLLRDVLVQRSNAVPRLESHGVKF
jgi:hypothetical protein